MESKEKYHHEADSLGTGRNTSYSLSLLKGMCPRQSLGWRSTVSDFSFSCSEQQFPRQENKGVKRTGFCYISPNQEIISRIPLLVKRQCRLTTHVVGTEEILYMLLIAPRLIFPLVSLYNPTASNTEVEVARGFF